MLPSEREQEFLTFRMNKKLLVKRKYRLRLISPPGAGYPTNKYFSNLASCDHALVPYTPGSKS